jgi:hypothetical protein
MKQKKILEKRELKEILEETFGEKFCLMWFLPLRSGGYLNDFNLFLMRNKNQ